MGAFGGFDVTIPSNREKHENPAMARAVRNYTPTACHRGLGDGCNRGLGARQGLRTAGLFTVAVGGKPRARPAEFRGPAEQWRVIIAQ